MAWTAPKTWNYKEVLSFADLNTYLRDNMNHLYYSIQRVIGQWNRVQSAAIGVPAANAWNAINSGGLEQVSVGSVEGNDIVDVFASARCSNGSSSWSISIAIYANDTLIRRYSGARASSGESQSISISHRFGSAYDNVVIKLAIYPITSAGTLMHGTSPEVYGWMSVTHKRDPID